MNIFWSQQVQAAEQFQSDFKNHPLPLARIKKVMKSDQDVKMISAEAPILFSKACEIFISEITMRAWIHAEENKRRTLQRSDVASAVTRSDQFDFLIDIVPREEVPKVVRRPKEEVVGQQTEAMYDQNVLAYYQPPPGMQYTSEATAYYPQQQRIDAQSNKPQDKPIRQDQMPSTKVASIDDQLHDAAVVVAAFTAATQRQNDSQVRRDKNVTGK
ncbi:1393_t:CDS:2 [Paraglomus brasilianum]|uniref:1393_t:CDS:1 n=1 Tax=Paraglomus brasilianum TaxID=144538 RepID=A0A9N8ZIA7_9GLOM|nr:1393_t:CDS:2 [Paraglomus brasilianum]